MEGNGKGKGEGGRRTKAWCGVCVQRHRSRQGGAAQAMHGAGASSPMISLAGDGH